MMEEVHKAVERMRQALCQLLGKARAVEESPVEIDRLNGFAESIRWKLRFLEHHCWFISNAPWADVCRLGTPGFKDPVRVTCGEQNDDDCIVVELRTQDSGRMIMLASFDGIVAACVNSVDTLARMLNLAYGLGIEERHASLPIVAQRVRENCAVGLVLGRNPGIDWMSPVRLLRGECQHADIASVIREPDRAFGVPGDSLLLADAFSIDDDRGVTVAAYSQVLRDRTLLLLTTVAQAVAADPAHSVVRRPTA